jgi:hypothetical protein
MGALESLNGMILLGLTTAFLFSMFLWFENPLRGFEKSPDAVELSVVSIYLEIYEVFCFLWDGSKYRRLVSVKSRLQMLHSVRALPAAFSSGSRIDR